MPPKKRQRLSREDVVRLVEIFHGEVNNGGFDQFFQNTAGNKTAETIQALEAIGASEVGNLLKRAARKFPRGMPPKNRSLRENLLMESVSPNGDSFRDEDRQFYSRSAQLTELLEKYMGV
jgi:uncharacterized protein DUF4375